MPPRPDLLYGAFKVLARRCCGPIANGTASASVSLRIGTYRPLPIDQRSLATWLSPRDVSQLVDLSLRHPDPGALVVNGYSGNTRIKTQDPNWALLGYVPRDNAEEHVEMLRAMGVDVDGPWEWPSTAAASCTHRSVPVHPLIPGRATLSMMRRRSRRKMISMGTTLTTEPAISLPVSLVNTNWNAVSPSSMLNRS